VALLLSLGSALTFGAADFLGGLASRRADAVPVAATSQLVGLLVVAAAMPLLSGTASTAALAWGGIAGVGGSLGLITYFRALSIGVMGVTAPLASLVGAAIPVAVGIGVGERPALTAAVGVVLGVVATVLVSRTPAGEEEAARPGTRRGIALAVAAGLLFGLFFVALDRAPDDSGLWPLVGARAVGLVLLGGVLAARRPGVPDRRAAATAAVSGVLDMAANVLFLLATRQGLLTLTAVVTSLYPVGVVVLAWLVLRERLVRSQVAGMLLALVATALIAV
jgi:drug/metabolite transporter (DMT)-like permease